MVVHANHPNEIDDEVVAALRQLTSAGIALFNQSVLLRGVNDDAAVLTDLSETLFEAGVTPYYLHLLDRVQGAAHFEVDVDAARALHRQVRENLPGYLVPQLVQEVAGEPFKRPL
jgi:L-lysine 2,3-aminomutase